MSTCPRPIDPVDAEALAAGVEPVFASDAAQHVASCLSCREEVARAGRISEALQRVAGPLEAPDLSGRVTRLRAFSPRELRDFRLWGGACSLVAAVFLGGLLLLILPALTASEQATLGVSALAPLGMLAGALVKAIGQAISATPAGLEALSEVLRGERAVGLAAAALLAPVLVGLRWAVARARR